MMFFAHAEEISSFRRKMTNERKKCQVSLPPRSNYVNMTQQLKITILECSPTAGAALSGQVITFPM